MCYRELVSDKSAIEWTDATWNPIRGSAGRWTCRKISPGCDFCYASRLNHRFGGPNYAHVGSLAADVARLDERVLRQPYHWREPRKIFVCSMTDLFGEWVPDEWITRVFHIMRETPHHQYQVLTKRPKRFLELCQAGESLESFDANDFPNVWAGVSVEEQRFGWRIEHLRLIPAAVRFISAEPLLGPLCGLELNGIDWLITGGESGGPEDRALVDRAEVAPKPEAVQWIRDIRDQCLRSGVAFFHKQWGGKTPKSGGRTLDGRTWDQYPGPDRKGWDP
jgi:protein gp37